MTGESDGYGAGSKDLHVTDVTNHADLLSQNIPFTEDMSYAATIPYNAVSATVTDILP